MPIDKDTLLYGSFAKTAGSTGCLFHNAGFKKHNINAIYKSFSVDNIKDAITAMKTLNIKGAGVTMPFKMQVLEHLDVRKDGVTEVMACNTLVNDNGIITGYNTDFLAATDYLRPLNLKEIIILGRGGYAKAVTYACNNLNIKVTNINREHWTSITYIKNKTVFNCTPVTNIKTRKSVNFIDCIVSTKTGKELSDIQAKYQFKIYTGISY